MPLRLARARACARTRFHVDVPVLLVAMWPPVNLVGGSL